MKNNNILDNLEEITASEYVKKYSDLKNVNIQEIIKKNNIKLLEINFDKLSKVNNNENVLTNFKQKYNLQYLWGAIFQNENDLIIIYNNKFDESHRLISDEKFFRTKRFILAHMFSHCVLHKDHLKNGEIYLEFVNDIYHEWIEDEYTKREISANLYAQQLLMPEETLKNVLNQLLIPSVKSISYCFNVPDSVARDRLKHIKIAYLEDSYTK